MEFTGDESAAADITQEVFLKLLIRLREFRREAEFTTWLYRITANTCISCHRRSRRFVTLEEASDRPELIEDAPQEADSVGRQTILALKSAVLGLPTKQRLPLLLRYVAGLTYAEIAEVLVIPIGTAASRIERARRALRTRLSRLQGTSARE